MPIPAASRVVAEILGLVNRKDAAREKIVRVMWKPRKPRRGEDPTQTLLGRYAGTAGAICISTTGRTSRSSASCINIQSCRRCRRRSKTRGCSTLRSTIAECCIDAPLAAAASRLAAQALADLNERMRQETDGAVDKASKKEKLKAWLASQGVKLPRKQRKGKSGLQWKACLEAERHREAPGRRLAAPGRAYGARDQAAGGTIGGQQNRPDAARPAAPTGACEDCSDSTAPSRGDGPARASNRKT